MKVRPIDSVFEPEDLMSQRSGATSYPTWVRPPVAGPQTGESDLELLHRFAGWSDADAFAQIVQRYAACVYATCLRVLGDVARAEDASQETFYRLMRRPFDVTQNLGAWLHRTATHVALDQLRSESARRRRENVYGHDCDRSASTWFELSPMIDQALDDLPETTRDLLVQHYLMGKTQAQIAEESNQSPATISRKVKQGIEELRVRLRLKGVCAMPTVLAGLLCHVAIRRPPPGLMNELGKMAMFGAATHGGRGKIIKAKPAMTHLALMASGLITAVALIVLSSNVHGHWMGGGRQTAQVEQVRN